MDCFGECDYCHGSIGSGQRWVREKIFDPSHDGRDPIYHRYHAEALFANGDSCWEKHEIEREIARTSAYAA